MCDYFVYLWDHGIYGIPDLPEGVHVVHQQQHFSKTFKDKILKQSYEEKGLQDKCFNWHGLHAEWIPIFCHSRWNTGEQ